jgi:DNA polymerase III subunit beta
MRFIINSVQLLRQLNALKGTVPSSPVIPILENFLFQIENGILTITASDLQTSVIAQMTVDADEQGAIAIPAKILLETLKNLPEQPVTFTIDTENSSVEILSDNGKYKLAVEDGEDYPAPAEVEEGTKISLTSDVLSSAISYTLFAVSTDELKPAMNGVFIQTRADHVNFVSTDAHRLVRYRRNDVQAEQEASFIIPGKALDLLKNALPSDASQEIDIRFDDKNACFTFGNIKMVCRLIDERFPDYENVIPTNNPRTLTIDRQKMLSSLKRTVIYANKVTNQIRLNLENDTLNISGEDTDFDNKADENLLCEYEGEAFEIGFNAKFLIDMLGHMESQQVSFSFSEPNRAAIMLPTETEAQEDVLMLVMPIMLNSYY